MRNLAVPRSRSLNSKHRNRRLFDIDDYMTGRNSTQINRRKSLPSYQAKIDGKQILPEGRFVKISNSRVSDDNVHLQHELKKSYSVNSHFLKETKSIDKKRQH